MKTTKHTLAVRVLRYTVALFALLLGKRIAGRRFSETALLDALLRTLRRLRRPATWPKQILDWLERRIENRKVSNEAIRELKKQVAVMDDFLHAIDAVIEPYWSGGRINTLRRMVLKIDELRTRLSNARNHNATLKSHMDRMERMGKVLTAIDDVLAPFWSSDCYTPEETGMAVEQTIKEFAWMIQALRYTLRRHYDYYEMESCQCMEAPCVHTLSDYVLAFTDIADLDEARSTVQSSDLYVDVYEDKDARLTGFNAPDWIAVETVAHDDGTHRMGNEETLATVYLEVDDAGTIVTATSPAWVTVEFHTVEETDDVPA